MVLGLSGLVPVVSHCVAMGSSCVKVLCKVLRGRVCVSVFGSVVSGVACSALLSLSVSESVVGQFTYHSQLPLTAIYAHW